MAKNTMNLKTEATALRLDQKIIADMVTKKSRVLDIGCGDGALLAYLVRYKNIIGRGIEISTQGVYTCVSAGLSVIQGDADIDLLDYPEKSFDFVILSQTLQAMKKPLETLRQLLRISHKVIISFPNFGHWKVRWSIGIAGKMPVNAALPYEWYETPNIHFCTIKDFFQLCHTMNITILLAKVLSKNKKQQNITSSTLWKANVFGEQAIFLLEKH